MSLLSMDLVGFSDLGRILAIVWVPLGQHKNMEFSNQPKKSNGSHMKNNGKLFVVVK